MPGPSQRAQTARPRPIPPLLPAPQRIESAPGVQRIRASAPIVLAAGTTTADDVSALRLRAGIAAATGHTLPIEAHGDPADLPGRIELRIDTGVSARSRPALRAQAYRLEVRPDGVSITGGGAAGLRYGCETLLQLVDARGRAPACRIEDAPDFELRGIMLDVSRGKVPTTESLEALIDLCAVLKLNVLMLYTEHTFRFRRHPEIGSDADPLDAETLRRLDAHAAAQCVELVPCLQSLGHMEHILCHDRYASLAETERGWTIAPEAEGTYPLLADLYAEYLPNFRSSRFNANCDEPWDLGRGRSAARAKVLGPGGLYLEHVRRLRRMAARHGKRMMIWGDVVHAHPERIPEIDPGITLLDWWYEADFDYDRVRVFAENGLDFLVCPGTSSWNSLFPRVANSQLNISRWASAGRRHGARGLINTDWGDHGHYNLQGNSYLAYAWGAQESWSGSTPDADFDRAFSRVLFGEPRGAVARLYRELGAIHDPGFSIANGSALQYLFFDDVESAYFVSACKRSALARAADQIARMRPRLVALRERVKLERLAIDELVYAADASAFALAKAEAGLDYATWRSAPTRWRAADRKRLAARLDALASEQKGLARTLRRLWLARARPSNLADTLRRIQGSVRSMRAAARRLRANRPSAAPDPGPLTPQGVLEAVRASLRR